MAIHKQDGYPARLGRGVLLAACVGIAGLFTLGCGSGTPDEGRIAGAIARSDSLRRTVYYRHPKPWEAYPVASRADSDSVVWLNASPHVMSEVH